MTRNRKTKGTRFVMVRHVRTAWTSLTPRLKLRVCYLIIGVLVLVLAVMVVRDMTLTGSIVSGLLAGAPLLFES